MPLQPNHYATLGIAPTATEVEIKKEYRRLARIYHPDKNLDDKGPAEAMLKINEAYEVLRDSESRRLYDRNCKLDGVQPATFAVPKTPSKNRGKPRKSSMTGENREEIPTERAKEGNNVAAEEERAEKERAERARREGEKMEKERVERERVERERAEREREEREKTERVQRERERAKREAERIKAEMEEIREKIRKQREYREAEWREAQRKLQAEKDREDEITRRVTQQLMDILQGTYGHTHGYQKEHCYNKSPHYMPPSTSTPTQLGGSRWLVDEGEYLLELCAQTNNWEYIKKMINARFGRGRTSEACRSKYYRLRRERSK